MTRRGTQSSKWDGLPIDEGLSYIALSVADMDIECSPAIRDAVARRAAEGLFGYTDLPPDHVDLPVEWLGRRHGWSVPREHIVAAHRIVQVVALILGAHTRPGDGIVLFTPSYSPLENAIGLNQREAVRVPLIQTPMATSSIATPRMRRSPKPPAYCSSTLTTLWGRCGGKRTCSGWPTARRPTT